MKLNQLSFVLFFALLIVASCKENIKEHQKPKGLITYEQANKLEEAYKKNQHQIINKYLSNDGIAITDNREVWFSLDELENYINYVKKESTKNKLENLGLRVYFGAKKDENNVYKSTIFFFPTNKSNTKSGSFTSLSKSSFSNEDSNINSYGIDGLNYGSSGRPPSEFEQN